MNKTCTTSKKENNQKTMNNVLKSNEQTLNNKRLKF